MNLLDIFQRGQKVDNYTLKDASQFRGGLVGGENGVDVSDQSIMGLSGFYQGLRLLSESVGSLPCKVYRRLPNGDKEVAENNALYPILSLSPNSEMTPQELFSFIVSSCIMRGTAYCEVIRDGAARVRSVEPLNSEFMQVDRDANGKLVYRYDDNQAASRVIPARNIWRIPALGNDGVTGLSIPSLAKRSLGISIGSEDHALRTFTNGARLAGFFQTPKRLSEGAFEQLKNSLNSFRGSKGAEATPLLEEGLEFNGVSMSHDDAQFLESRLFQVDELARWFNIPPNMLYDLSRSTYSNVEQQTIQFVTYTIRPWLTRIEQTITRDLILPRQRGEYFAEFSIEGLLRGDTESRYNAYASGINNGWLNRNEVRSLENLNSVDGLDEFLVPLNMVDAGDEATEDDQPDDLPEDQEGGEIEPDDQASARDALKIINEKEINAIRNEFINRGAGDDFNEWAGDFYSRLSNTLEIEHGLDGDSAEAWATARLNQLLEADDVLALLTEWSEST